MPIVRVYLSNGEVLDVCHVIGLASTWLALAIYDDPGGTTTRAVRKDLVPYGAITRIAISKGRGEGAQIGFNPDHSSFVVNGPSYADGCNAESMLGLMKSPHPSGAEESS